MVLEKPEISCDDVTDLLGDYVEGDLMPTIVQRLDHHIAECAHCRELKHGYLTTIALARGLGDKPMPRDVQSRLRKALKERLGIDLSSAS